jgi:hypothetical protein
VRYPISEFFRLNRSARAESFQWKEKFFNSRTEGERNSRNSEDLSELRNGPTTTRLHQKKVIAPSCDIRFSCFLGWIEARERRFSMDREILDSRTQGHRNARKSEDVPELRNGPTTTKLHQKKLIAPSCDIWFSSFLGWIEARDRKVLNGKRNFEF